MKYIHNILRQYKIDGLSSQRFDRETQEGIGHDILSGISTTITALYRDIYGIRPMWNRMGLEPNMLEELNGTEFKYTLRGVEYNIKLSENKYQISTDRFLLDNTQSFGVNINNNTLTFYPQNQNSTGLSISRTNSDQIKIEIVAWAGQRDWVLNSAGNYNFSIEDLKPNATYKLTINNGKKQKYSTDANGVISFEHQCKVPTSFSLIE